MSIITSATALVGLNEENPNNLSALGFVPQPNLPEILMA